MPRRLRNWAAAGLPPLLLGLFALACSRRNAPAIIGSTYPLAPPVQRFVEEHGGLRLLGDPLEPAIEVDGITRQTFLNVQVIFGPSGATSGYTGLAPLGWRLGLAQPPSPAGRLAPAGCRPPGRRPERGPPWPGTASAPNNDVGASPPQAGPGARSFQTTGHTFDAGFASLFQELGGESVVGAPIAEAEAHHDQVVQYFENVGMVRNLGASSSEARLLPLGAAALKEFAGYAVEGFRILPGREIVLRPFQLFVVPLGGEAIFGRPLSEPYLTQDGAIEQVYERAILYSPANALGESHLRPLGAQLGPPDAPVQPSVDPDSIYFSSTGHNVRWAFAYFFLNHGEERILGRPLEEAKLDGAFLSQRFENVVLRYDFTLPSHLAVQLEPLGRDAYLQRASAGAQPIPPDPDLASTPLPAANMWVPVQAWAEHPSLPSSMPQRIIVRVSRPDGTPWTGVRPIVAVTTAARGTFYPQAQPTDTQGSSVLVLELADLLPGEIVNFEVAIAGEGGIGYAFGQFAAPLSAP